ncbi:hypothetical protein CSKR_108785 [Clonorchis sinensis]|uniref:Uncharacterized protein n=1 Tax=Clonorchis sinensis TaxID=79923 RepID=A0A3R7CFA7_CLOSI|nr:hypothetical protein CSKR_108785 [Clonorchis sinensis]
MTKSSHPLALHPQNLGTCRARWFKWLERELTDRKVRGSNPTSASRLPLSRLGRPGSIPALVLPPGGMAARHQKARFQVILSQNQTDLQISVFIEISLIWVQVEHKVDRNSGTAST